MTRIVYCLLDATSRVGVTENITLNPGDEGNRFQTVPPPSSDVYRAPFSSPTIKPTTIGGTWSPRVPNDAEIASSKTVALYVHGGAFVAGDGRDAMFGTVANRLLKKSGLDFVFSVQHRLSGHGGVNPFPAAPQDVLAAYLFLLDTLRIPASQIVVVGDSSGGNLIQALLRYLSEHGAELGAVVPWPRAAVLLSPWVAPFEYKLESRPNFQTDFVPASYAAWGAHCYGGDQGASNPYVTPLGHPFALPVPVFVNAGEREITREFTERWVDEMRRVEGNDVQLSLELGAVHDTFFLGPMMGFGVRAEEVAVKIGEFLRKI
ncbi:hypothetical protein PG994_014296 [Apiospora phragmitis]|uniref:Alpha/beta hydrolase fold-3 domain-containing protein n=1 Tax=Apiospora phragmitis TaxID=2905665 RepID=A0ABR1T3X0_9PEZI